ncbi:hypothetical protein LINPERHAP2_LOCUS19905 [Linum perenne]
MNPRILSWNVRGLGDVSKQFRIKARIRDMLTNICCFQETKLSEVDRLLVFRLLGRRSWGWEAVSAIGSRGGLLMVWDEDVVQLENHWEGRFVLVTIFILVSNNFFWSLCNVYGPVNLDDKAEFLEELRGVLNWWTFPVGVLGDLNMVRNLEEVSSGVSSKRELVMFNDFIEDCGLIDLPLGGASFTFSNMQAEFESGYEDMFRSLSFDSGLCPWKDRAEALEV